MLEGFFFPSGRGPRILGSIEIFDLHAVKYGEKDFHLTDLEATHPQRVLFTTICNCIHALAAQDLLFIRIRLL